MLANVIQRVLPTQKCSLSLNFQKRKAKLYQHEKFPRIIPALKQQSSFIHQSISRKDMGWILPNSNDSSLHATTVLSIRRNNKVVIIADGQVTLGATVVKPNANKIRRLGPEGNVIAGFAGSTADAFALFERLEERLESHPGQLLRACVEMAKAWRMDRYLRRLEAVMIVCNKDHSLMLTGNGDVQDFSDGLIAIGSGGPYAFAAAKALLDTDPDMDAEDIAHKAMDIASDLCIYTNKNFVKDKLTFDDVKK